MKKQLLLLLLWCLPCAGSAQGIITTVAGTGTYGCAGMGGPATAAQLFTPINLVFDKAGNYYFTDSGTVIRKVDKDGVISIIAGCCDTGGKSLYDLSGSAPATVVKFSLKEFIACDIYNNIYISGGAVWKIDSNGNITHFAGTAGIVHSGDGGPATAACIPYAKGVAADKWGNVYIGGQGRLRKVDASGVITTIAGTDTLGFSGDGGPATAAKCSSIYGVAVDTLGNVYFSDVHNWRIRKIDRYGIISTIAGDGLPCSSPDSIPATSAKVCHVVGIYVTPSGSELYFGEGTGNRLCKVDSNGIRTFITSPKRGFSGDGGDPKYAQVDNPFSPALSPNGELYFTDLRNRRIRKISFPLDVPEVADNRMKCQVYPNPSAGQLQISFPAGLSATANITLSSAVGQVVFQSSVATSGTATIRPDVSSGTYTISIVAGNKHFSGQIIVNR